ncbi:MAG TPA: RDD family protein, partial [Burkholderiales bacterium]|nr:RDD family protein [Burkholderiales bacterium]
MTQPPTAVYPSLFRRVASLGYEGLLVAAILVAGGLAFSGAAALLGMVGMAAGVSTGLERVLLQAFLVTLLGAYFVRSWVRGGQTLAMKAWRLRLVRADGRGVGAGQALLRFVLGALVLGTGAAAAMWLWRHSGSVPGWLAALPAAVDLGWILCDRERQFLHDR